MKRAAVIFLPWWLSLSGAGSAEAQEGFDMQQLAEQQARQDRNVLDDAKELLAADNHAEAALAAHLGRDLKDIDQQEESIYVLGKALYRLELYHSALQQFAEILEKGPDSRFFDAALEWCLFISRKLVDDASVNEVIAKYGSRDFPENYRDEFLFRLARYHYLEALRRDGGPAVAAGQRDKEGLSIEGNIFGTGGDRAPAKVEKRRGGGLSIGGDLFGTASEEPEAESEEGVSLGGEGALSASAHLVEAEKLSLRVSDGSRFGPRARFLTALVQFKNGRENDALGSFKEVVRTTGERDDRGSRKLRELAFFQLARTHFGAQQPSFATFYYDRIDRDSTEWLDALFEDSWAHFRLGNYEKALGNLLTLHSPFFEDAYFPESLILKAVIYYENCRYAEAEKILEDFLSRYEPVLEELGRITSQPRSATEYFDLLEGIRNPDLASQVQAEAATLEKILGLAMADPQLARLDASQGEVKAELARLREEHPLLAGTPLADTLTRTLARKRADLVGKAGAAIERRLVREQEHIKELVQQAVRIGIETARSEQERIESKLRRVQTQPKSIEKTFVRWTDDEKIVWPFEGEYWRDELGTYELTLARSCR